MDVTQGTGPRECTLLASHGLTFTWRAALYIGKDVVRINWKFLPMDLVKKDCFFVAKFPRIDL